MTNGDFPYWEGRTQPAGATESDIRPQQLEALQSYLNQRTGAVGATFPPQQHGFAPSPYQHPAAESPQQPPKQQAAIADHPTISITAGKTRIDITITPL